MKDIVKNVVAFDCGNSSVRVLLGRFDGEKIETTVIHQVENREIKIDQYYYWDILYIFHELQRGLKMAYEECGHIDSAAISTWGIDFGMIGEQGQLIANPLCYRNGLGGSILDRLSTSQRREMFDATGIHNHQMNSLYQLLAYQEVFPNQLNAVNKILLIPDLLCYLFTGSQAGERTIASTTQYYSVYERKYSQQVISKFNLDSSQFPPLINNGQVIGSIREDIAQELKINVFPFVCVPSHDTASAVAAVPAKDSDFIFISSGTWGLVGTELNHPIINDSVYDSGLANEEGAFGTITLLKNGAGMFIVQRIREELSNIGQHYTWDEIVKMAKTADDRSLLFDPNGKKLFNPPSMIKAIRQILKSYGQNGDCSIEEIILAFYTSIALSYRYTIEQISSVTKKTYNKIYIIGGGSRNDFLNQLVANVTNMNVTAGPAEATSLGNIAVQLVNLSTEINGLEDIRTIIRRSINTKEFTPEQKVDDLGYQRYLRYISLA